MCALVGCMNGGANRLDEGLATASSEEGMPQAVDTIDRSSLATVLEEGGYVAIVRVTDATPRLEGTRSERFVATAEVLHRLHGELPDTVTIQRFTSGGDLVLQPGRVYAVALQIVPAFSENPTLTGHVEVADDAIQASLERHRDLLATLGG